MLKSTLFKRSFFLLFLLGIADFFANKLYLYWTLWWFDNFMHFFAGVCVAMFTVLVWQNFLDKNLSFIKAISVSILLSLIVGIIWEDFELYFRTTQLFPISAYFYDTATDLVLDIFGGIFGGIYGYYLIKKK